MEASRKHATQRWVQYRIKNGRDLLDAEVIKKRWKEYMEEQYEKKILVNLITLMVWLVSQSQTFWSVKSSGP